MTYKKTLQWMFAQLPMYQQKGTSAYKDKLDNILDFAALLGHPEVKFKSIHVAGTNGKGSCCHMLASILQEAGYKVGLYTSPHLKDFRERIKINGQCIPKKNVKRFIETHRPFLAYHRLSFFEMTVGMAFDHFAQEKVDIAIIEVGLGGRLDSTNIITPEVSLITNIGMDHMDLLGNTLQKIAMEKAGIIKVGIPVVIGERQAKTDTIFQLIAAQRKSKLVFADDTADGLYETDLLGKYQEKNIRGVLTCLGQLTDFVVPESAIVKGLKRVVSNTGLLGRWQVLAEDPKVICDAAHNKEGLQMVVQQLQSLKAEELHMVLGFVNDKELDGLLPLFPKEATYYFVRPDVPRGLNVEQLRDKAAAFGLNGKSYKSVKKGLKSALKQAAKKDLVFVGGSTFVVAEVV